MPQVQTPAAQKLAVVESQLLQVVPASAQVDRDIDWHVPEPSQQPVGQDVAVHLQTLSTHSRPGSQACPSAPQTQAPEGPQRLASARLEQSMHTSPELPHSVLVFA